MRERELQRRRAQRHAVTLADAFDGCHTRNEFGGRRLVVEAQRLLGSRDAGGKNARIEYAAKRDTNAARLAQRQQLGQRAMIEQGVASGEQQAVEVGLTQTPRRRSASG